MSKKVCGLCLALIFAVAALAYAQAISIAGIVENVRPVIFGDKSAILLSLKGRSETFVISTADAPKFGLLKPETAAAPDKAKMTKELEAAKGLKVRMAVQLKPDTKGQEYAVQSFERLPVAKK